MGTHPIFESDFDCLTDQRAGRVESARKVFESKTRCLNNESPALFEKIAKRVFLSAQDEADEISRKTRKVEQGR